MEAHLCSLARGNLKSNNNKNKIGGGDAKFELGNSKELQDNHPLQCVLRFYFVVFF